MLRAAWVLSLLLALCFENAAAQAAVETAPVAPSVETHPVSPEITKADKAKIEQSVSEAKQAAKASADVLVVPPPFVPSSAALPKDIPVPVPAIVAAPNPPAIAPTALVPSTASVAEAAPVAVAIPAVPPATVKASDQKVIDAPLADIDPETFGLLTPSNGGLEPSLWQATSRAFVDRLMSSIVLPTPSATLNDLARRMLLTSAALPVAAGSDEKPKRSLMAARIEALLELGAVPEAWKLASLAGAGLVDSVTLRGLAEASLIGPESKDICDKIPSLMQAHGKTEESATEWQKSLLICQLRAKDTKAVQVGLDLMREQASKDAIFLSLVNRNLIGEGKQLPRQLTPLRPTNLAVLRQLELPLPSELYAKPEAALIPELLQTRAVDEKARLSLAERAGARGIITPAQLAAVYQSIVVTPQDMTGGSLPTDSSPRSRAILYQAALNEQSAAKKIDIVQKFIADVEPAALTGAQIKLAANLLETVPVTSDSNSASVAIARLFAMAGRPDQTLSWLKLARAAGARSPEIATQLTEAWPLFVLLGIVPDGDYAQGMKAWMGRALADVGDGKDIKDKRQRAGKILLLLSAAGYAVTDEGWQKVIDVVPASKQISASPLIQERLRMASGEGRKGETILLSLLIAGGPQSEPSFGSFSEIVRALRLAGLIAESQSLAREAVVGLGG